MPTLAALGDGGRRRMSRFCVRGNSCVGLGDLALNCALPGTILSGVGVHRTHVCFRTRGLFAVANCANTSPRNLNCPCPLPHAFSLKLSFNFWALGLCCRRVRAFVCT